MTDNATLIWESASVTLNQCIAHARCPGALASHLQLGTLIDEYLPKFLTTYSCGYCYSIPVGKISCNLEIRNPRRAEILVLKPVSITMRVSLSQWPHTERVLNEHLGRPPVPKTRLIVEVTAHNDGTQNEEAM